MAALRFPGNYGEYYELETEACNLFFPIKHRPANWKSKITSQHVFAYKNAWFRYLWMHHDIGCKVNTAGFFIMNNCFKVDGFDRGEWTTYGKLFAGYNIGQTWGYGEGHCKRPFYGVSRAILFQGDRPLVMAQFRIAKIPGIKIGVATCEWGPLWHFDDDRGTTDAQLSEFLSKAKEEYVKKRGLSIRFDLRSTFAEDQDAHLINVFEKNGFKYDPQTRKYRTFVLDLSLDANELSARLHPEWRRRLKVSEKAGFEVEWGSSVEMFDRFRKVYDKMWAHKKFPTGANMNMIRKTLTIAKPEKDIVISIIGYQGEDVCAHIDSPLGNTMLSYLGASCPKARKNTNPGYFIRWAVIQKAKDMGLRWYDLGGITDLPSGEGVDEFKKRMNGKHIMYPGRFEVRNGKVLGTVIDVGIKYFSKLSQLLLVTGLFDP